MQEKKNISGKHNSKLSSESPYSILHIASISLCIIFFFSPYKQWEEEEGKWNNPTQKQRESNDETVQLWPESPAAAQSWTMDAPIQYCTQVIIQIYTDSGVMYKNENGRNLRHYARVCSISRLHLSSKKLADNTKRAFKVLQNLKVKREKPKKSFSGSKAWIFVKGQKSFICTCPHYKC